MPRPLALVSPETGKTYPLNDVRRIAFGDPEAFAAGRPVNLVPQYPEGTFTTEAFLNAFAVRRGVWDFQALLPVDAETPPVSIGEGNTPLVPLPYGHGNLMLKDESRNATWSHKDRAMTVALTVAKSSGFRTTVGASTGNAGAALAAYSARAGMRCVMFTGTDAPSTMQTLMQVYGAMLCLVPGSVSRRGAAKIGLEQYGWWPGTNVTDPPVGSNTYGIEGYTTIAYELVRDLGDAPAAVVVPTSYGDILTGLWRGFTRMQRRRHHRAAPPPDRRGTGKRRAVWSRTRRCHPDRPSTPRRLPPFPSAVARRACRATGADRERGNGDRRG